MRWDHAPRVTRGAPTAVATGAKPGDWPGGDEHQWALAELRSFLSTSYFRVQFQVSNDSSIYLNELVDVKCVSCEAVPRHMMWILTRSKQQPGVDGDHWNTAARRNRRIPDIGGQPSQGPVSLSPFHFSAGGSWSHRLVL